MANENSDWIEWTGGECPVGMGVKVQVRYRGESRNEAKSNRPVSASNLRWNLTARSQKLRNIEEYRVVLA